MFQKIYRMYSDINNKEETNTSFLLTIVSDHKYINKVSKTKLNSHKNHQKEYPFQARNIFPPDLHQIQPRDTQVWDFDEIGLEPNSKGRKVVCTYNYFQGEIMWKA